jgi:hypothetical protein
MHPEIHAQITMARTIVADRRAERARLARAVKQDRPELRRDGTRRLLPRLRLWGVLRRLAGDQTAP